MSNERLLLRPLVETAANNNIEFDADSTGLGDAFGQPLWLGWGGDNYDLSHRNRGTVYLIVIC